MGCLSYICVSISISIPLFFFLYAYNRIHVWYVRILDEEKVTALTYSERERVRRKSYAKCVTLRKAIRADSTRRYRIGKYISRLCY